MSLIDLAIGAVWLLAGIAGLVCVLNEPDQDLY